MSDAINEGFGASAPVTLTQATNDLLCRYIAAPPDQYVRIRSIDIAAVQMAAVVGTNTVIPIFVLRGHNNLGVQAQGGGLTVPLRPTGLVCPGLPDVGQLAGTIELLYATYVISRGGRLLFVPNDDEKPQDLVARDGQKLVVCVGPLVDVSVSPAVQLAGASTGVSLTVLGSQGRLNERTKLPGQIGETKSLQRYEIDVSEAVNASAHPSYK